MVSLSKHRNKILATIGFLILFLAVSYVCNIPWMYPDIVLRAHQCDSVAQFKMGVIYRDGFSYARGDKDAALKWFLKSAEKGHPEALYAVGEIYRSAAYALKLSEKDMKEAESKAYEKAKPWFEQAAVKNHLRAKFSMVAHYIYLVRRSSAERDIVQLYVWQGLARSNSTPESRRRLFKSNNKSWKFKITEAQIREAEKLIKQWKPVPAPPPIDMSDLKPSKLNRLLKPKCNSPHCYLTPQY